MNLDRRRLTSSEISDGGLFLARRYPTLAMIFGVVGFPMNSVGQFFQFSQEQLAKIAVRPIPHPFPCPDYRPPSTHALAKLPSFEFIVYALHRTKLHQSVTFAALILLQRPKRDSHQLAVHLVIDYLYQHS
jgi:hypothetical protein